MECGVDFMKKILVWLLIGALLCASALADAGVSADMERLGIYAAFQWDKDSGEWSVTSNQAWMALQLAERNAVNFADSFLLMYLEVTGSLQTGRVSPILHLVYVDTEEIHPTSVSFLVGSRRYDYLATPWDASVGREHAEHMQVLLDAAGLDMLREIAREGNVQIRLGGGAGKVNVTLQALDSYKNALQKAHGLCVEGLAPMLEELDAMGFEGYDLWDLTRACWTAAGGEECRYQAVDLAEDVTALGLEVDLKNDFQMISSGASGRDVTKLQQRLVDLGYLYMNNPSGTFAESTGLAVRAAQRYYGMLETGSADAALVERLFGEDQMPWRGPESVEAEVPAETAKGQVEAQLGQAYLMEGTGVLTLNRSWFAPSVCAVGEGGAGAARTVENRDHTLLICDGTYTSLYPKTANFYTVLQARAVYGDYEYECFCVCQADGGTRFDTAVMPLDEVRIVFYAEIPARLAGEPFRLRVTAGDAELAYELN